MGNIGNLWFQLGLDNKAFIEGLKASKTLAVETTTEIEKMMKLDSSRVSNKNTQLLKQQKIEAEINLTNEKALAAKIAGEARLTESIARRTAIEVESAAKLQLLNEQKAAVQLITDARLSESFARRAATEAASQAASQMSAEKRAAFLLESESKLDALFEKRVAAEKKALTDLQNSIKNAASERALNDAKRIEAIKKANAAELTAISEAEKRRAATANMIANDEEKRRLSIQRRMDMERRLAITNERHAAFMARQNVTASAQAASFTRILQGQLPILSQLKTMAGTYLSIWMAVRFVKNLATISGEFELQRKSLEAILQDSVAAAKIFTQIKQLAVESPFQFKDMVSYAKQLSAFSIPIDELYDTTKRLADISAGLGVDMGRIILAYGQVRSASVLRGQELRQFTEAGIPLVADLAKEFSKLENRVVTTGEVFERISNRMVPFEMIKKIFVDLTSEGGKFFEQQEIQAATLKGQISNLTDAYQIMLSEMGKDSEGLLKTGVQGIRALFDNWENVVKILATVLAAYGAYKAVLISVVVWNKTLGLITMAKEWYAMGRAIGFGAANLILFDNGQKAVTATSRKMMTAVPWALALAALAAATAYLYTAYQNAHKLEKELNKIAGKNKGAADVSVLALNGLIEKLKTTTKGSKAYADVINEINNRYGDFLPNLLAEADGLEEIEKKLQGVTRAIYEKAKAQAYSEGISEIESDLSDEIKGAYDSAINSLTKKPLMGYNIFQLSKEEANKMVAEMFSMIRSSPELYKNIREVDKLISETLFKYTKSDQSKYFRNYPQLDGLVEGVTEYSSALLKADEAQRTFSGSIDAMYGTTNNYDKEVTKINLAYEEQMRVIKNKVYMDDAEGKSKARLNDELNAQLDRMNKLVKVYTEFQQIDLVKKTEQDIAALKATGEEWFVRATELAESNQNFVSFKPLKDETIFDYLKRIQDIYDELYKQQQLISKGLLVPAITGENVPAQIAAIKEIARLLSFTLNDPNDKKDPEDKMTKELKRQFDIIKDAKAEYEKLKQIMSETDARKIVSAAERYKGVDVSKLEDAGMQGAVEDMIKKVSVRKSEAAKEFKQTLLGYLFDIKQDDMEKDVKRFIDNVNEAVNDYTKNFKLYEQLLEYTNDKDKAIKLSFGVDFNGEVDLETFLRKEMEKLGKDTGINLNVDLMSSKFKDLFPEKDLEKVEKVLGTDKFKLLQSIFEKLQSVVQEGLKTDYNLVKSISDELNTMQDNSFQLETGTANIKISRVAQETQKAYADLAKKEKDIVDEIAQIKDEKLREEMKAKYEASKKYFVEEKENIRKLQEEKLKSKADDIIKQSMTDKGLSGAYSEISDASYSELVKMQRVLKSLKDYKLSPELLAQIQAVGLSADEFKDALNIAVEGTKDSVDERLFDKIAGSAKAAADGAVQLGDSLYNLGEATGDQDMMKFGDTLSSVGQVMGEVANLASAIAKGDPAAIIASVFSIATKFIEAEARHQAALKKLEAERLAVLREINLEMLKATLESKRSVTIFGTDNYTKALDAIRSYKASVTELNEALAGSSKRGLSLAARLGFSSAKGEIEAARKGLLGLYNITVTGAHHKSGLFGWGKGWYEENSILKEYKNLIDADGKLNLTLAKNILANREMKEDQKTALQNIIDLAEAGEDALSQMQDYLSSIFGELGNNVSDALVDAFVNGTNAAVAFGDSVEAVLENMIKDMAYAQFLQPIFAKASSAISDMQLDTSLTEEDKRKKTFAIMGDLFNGALGMQQAMNDYYEAAQKEGAKYGFNLFEKGKDSTSGGLAKGIAGITEDTADILASYVNAIRGDVSVSRGLLRELVEAAKGNSNVASQHLAHLKAIEANTGISAAHAVKIYDILDSVTKAGSGKKLNI